MNIDSLTIGEAKELIKMLSGVGGANTTYSSPHLGKFVLLRTRDSGVHCGDILSQVGQTVELRDARRIWRWRGANTLNELSVNGASMTEYTRISEPVARITILDVLEIIPCTDIAAKNLEVSRWM